MPHIFVTRHIPDIGIRLLREKGFFVTVSEKNGALTKEELASALKQKPYDGVLSLLTDRIDAEIFNAAPSAKIFSNCAVGVDNIDVVEATRRGIMVTNTPGILTDTVAEHTIALMLAITRRVVEADRFIRELRFKGWEPELFLGTDLNGKHLGILGAGRIGARVIHSAVRGFNMRVSYYDVSRNESIERTYGAVFRDTPEKLLSEADIVSVHVPLLPTTHHLLDARRFSLMKRSAYLINTSRGPVVDENALVSVLRQGIIRGAALDVFEHEPGLAPGLAELPNVVLTPHIASATEETRGAMARLAAENLIAFFEGHPLPNVVP